MCAALSVCSGCSVSYEARYMLYRSDGKLQAA